MKEADIRPKDVFDRFLQLSAEDAIEIFDGVTSSPCSCPGCGENDSKLAFNKMGFCYHTCNSCDSLFLNPRPSSEAFSIFYANSKSAKYFAEVFIPIVMEERRQAMFIPRVKKVREICNTAKLDPNVVLEIGAGHAIFLEEWKKQEPNAEILGIEPNPKMAQYCRNKGVKILEVFAEEASEWHGKAELAVSFEVLEHVTDIFKFVKSGYDLLRPGGMFIATSLCADGFDIQILKEKSKSVTPPHHINFCSVEGYRQLFSRAGFTNLDIQTPGELDVEIVINTLRDVEVELGAFEQKILTANPEQQAHFQTYLSENQLSSHCWITARKPN
jgi:SAM-dependent methyltransferase